MKGAWVEPWSAREALVGLAGPVPSGAATCVIRELARGGPPPGWSPRSDGAAMCGARLPRAAVRGVGLDGHGRRWHIRRVLQGGGLAVRVRRAGSGGGPCPSVGSSPETHTSRQGSNSSTALRSGPRGGGAVGSSRCLRIFSTTTGSERKASTTMGTWHLGQERASTSRTRLSRDAQDRRRGRRESVLGGTGGEDGA